MQITYAERTYLESCVNVAKLYPKMDNEFFSENKIDN